MRRWTGDEEIPTPTDGLKRGLRNALGPSLVFWALVALVVVNVLSQMHKTTPETFVNMFGDEVSIGDVNARGEK